MGEPPDPEPDGARSPPGAESTDEPRESRRWTRRRALAYGLGGAVSAALVGVELVSHGVLPGKQALDELDGACDVSAPAETFAPAGRSVSGRFFSQARRRYVGYTIAYPPGHPPGTALALVIVLHAYGSDHSTAFSGMTLAQALASKTNGHALAPMALVAADGGDGYWTPHPGDDPMAMIVGELLPMCRRRGLGRSPRSVAAMGTSMGGYGALLLAEQQPHLIAAVAAISPAVWTTYAQAHAANPGAYASAGAFADNDVIAHASNLTGIPVRIASGSDDPFRPGVRALAHALPAPATVDLTSGCHDSAFFASQQPAALTFIAEHIAAGRASDG